MKRERVNSSMSTRGDNLIDAGLQVRGAANGYLYDRV